MAKQTFTTGQVLTAAQMTSLQQTAMGGGSATAKTASYVLTAADAGTTVIMNSASSTTITVNTGLFAAGDTVFIVNQGAGVCTITAGTATVSTAGSLALGANETGQLYFLSASAAIFSDYFQSGGTGGMTLLSTITLSGSSTTYNSITTGYKYLKLVGVNVQNNTTARDIDIQVNGASTGVYLGGVANSGGSGAFAVRTNGAIPISAGSGVKNATNVTFVCDIYNYDSATVEKVIHLDGLMTADYLTTIQAYTYGGVFKSTTAITSLVVLSSSGTLSGTIYAYGVN